MSSPTEPEEEKYYRSLREYSRADAYLPVQIRLVDEKERQTARSRTAIESALTEHQDMPEPDDRVLAECLRVLNSKLDTIIRMLAFQTRNHEGFEVRMVNISAGGISTSTKEGYGPQAFVEVRLMLPTTPYMVFYLYGNVVKCAQDGDLFNIFIEFTEIDEDIREHIAKYVFERQREILRKKRRP